MVRARTCDWSRCHDNWVQLVFKTENETSKIFNPPTELRLLFYAERPLSEAYSAPA